MLNLSCIEGMADWVRVVDKEGTIIYANKTMKEHLGDNIVGMKCYKAHLQSNPCTFVLQKKYKYWWNCAKEEEIKGRYFSVKSSPVTNSMEKSLQQ